MTEDEYPEPDPTFDVDPTPAPPAPVAPLVAYRDALKRYDGALLAAVARALGQSEPPAGRASMASSVADALGEPRAAERLLPALPQAPRLALTLMAVTETTAWTTAAMAHALACLGVGLRDAIGPLAETGLVAVSLEGGAAVRVVFEPVAVALVERPLLGLAEGRVGDPLPDDGHAQDRLQAVGLARLADAFAPR